jgi:hypothetical protein
MPRPGHPSFACLRRIGASCAALTALSIGLLPAQQASAACGLLQVAELQAAIGGTTATKPAGSRQAVQGMTVDECSLTLSGTGQPHPVSIRVITDLPMDGSEAITVRNRGTASEPQWKTAGSRLEQGTVGKAICILAGRPHVASHTTCSIPRGKGYVEVEVIGPVDGLPSIATVGALVQKAIGRL